MKACLILDLRQKDNGVYMAVKEPKLHGHCIYTLEFDTIEKLGGNLDEHFKEMVNPTPSGITLQKL